MPPGRLGAMSTTDAPPAEAGTTREPRAPRGPVPTWVRRTIIGAVLALCVVLLVVAYRVGEDGTESRAERDPVVVAQFPPPGGAEVRQTQVGAELKVGYDGRLTINGVAIPEEQMDGAVDPDSLTPEQLERFGVRPNSRNRVFFTPGEGKVIEVFEPGEVVIQLRYFRERRPEEGRTITWTIRVT